MKVGLLNKYNKTRGLAIQQQSLAEASYGLLSYFNSDEKGIKGKVGLLNKYNKTRGLAVHYLSTSYH